MITVSSAAVIALSATSIAILGLGSIVFLSTLLLTVALMLRSRWEKMANPDEPNHKY